MRIEPFSAFLLEMMHQKASLQVAFNKWNGKFQSAAQKTKGADRWRRALAWGLRLGCSRVVVGTTMSSLCVAQCSLLVNTTRYSALRVFPHELSSLFLSVNTPRDGLHRSEREPDWRGVLWGGVNAAVGLGHSILRAVTC